MRGRGDHAHMQWPAELQLLVDLTRDQNDSALAAALSNPELGNTIDWPKLTALAEHHGVEGLVAANLSAHKSASVPAPVRDHFTRRLRHHCLRSLVVNGATIELTNALSEAGISNILMKGHAISARYYDIPGARQCIDVDILVAKEELVRTRSIVEGLGFEQCSPDFAVPPPCEDVFQDLVGEIAYGRSRDGVSLDLHWHINSNPHLLNWQFDTVQRFTTSLPIGDTSVSVLETPAQMLYLCCHGAIHAWFRLKWLADIYRMLRALTDEQANQVVQMSQRDGTLRMIATSLRLLEITYNAPIGKFPKEYLRQHENKHLLSHMLKSIDSPALHNNIRLKNLGALLREYRYLLRLRSDIAHKSSVLWRALADVRDIQTIRLSRKWLWLYVVLGPWLKVIRIFDRELRALRPSG